MISFHFAKKRQNNKIKKSVKKRNMYVVVEQQEQKLWNRIIEAGVVVGGKLGEIIKK